MSPASASGVRVTASAASASPASRAEKYVIATSDALGDRVVDQTATPMPDRDHRARAERDADDRRPLHPSTLARRRFVRSRGYRFARPLRHAGALRGARRRDRRSRLPIATPRSTRGPASAPRRAARRPVVPPRRPGDRAPTTPTAPAASTRPGRPSDRPGRRCRRRSAPAASSSRSAAGAPACRSRCGTRSRRAARARSRNHTTGSNGVRIAAASTRRGSAASRCTQAFAGRPADCQPRTVTGCSTPASPSSPIAVMTARRSLMRQ